METEFQIDKVILKSVHFEVFASEFTQAISMTFTVWSKPGIMKIAPCP